MAVKMFELWQEFVTIYNNMPFLFFYSFFMNEFAEVILKSSSNDYLNLKFSLKPLH